MKSSIQAERWSDDKLQDPKTSPKANGYTAGSGPEHREVGNVSRPRNKDAGSGSNAHYKDEETGSD